MEMIEAVKIYNEKFKDLPYDRITETKSYFIFGLNPDKGFMDPILVNKKTKECRGYCPIYDGE